MNLLKHIGNWWSTRYKTAGCIGKSLLLILPLTCGCCFLTLAAGMMIPTTKEPVAVAIQEQSATDEPATRVAEPTATAEATLAPQRTDAAQPTDAPQATEAVAATVTPLPTDTPPPTSTQRPTSTPVPQLVLTSNGVNLRSGPSTAHDAIGTVGSEDALLVLARNHDSSWYNVQLADGTRGWVAASVAELSAGVDVQSVPIAATLPAPPTLPPPSPTAPPPTATIAPLPTAAPTQPAAPTAPPPPQPTSPPPEAQNCTPGYSPCIPPGPDVDCAGGSGNGPRYVQGPVTVDQSQGDPYDLDRDGDGVGCE